MIKINLLAERKPVKAKSPSSINLEGLGNARNMLLVLILALGFAAAGGWWWSLDKKQKHWRAEIQEADAELKRLEAAIKKGEEYEAQKALLARKIDLISNLKKQQAVPVRILDQVSRNLPDFLWLDTMSAANNRISISGKATTYTAVSNFYSNLSESGFFSDVGLGRTFEVPEGVSFSLTCAYAGPTGQAGENTPG